jgi:cytochrome c oxidase cbb3-type subunit 2
MKRRATAGIALSLLLSCHAAVPPPRREPEPRLPSWSRIAVPARPESTGLLELGERLYGWNCFPCHGAEGKGDGPLAVRQGLHPRDFTRGMFKLKTTPPGEMPLDDDLYRTLSAGIPLGGMPRNEALEAKDRWALVSFVKSLASPHFETKPPTRAWTAPPSPNPDELDVARGKELFHRKVQCGACHGPGGKGNGPAAPELRDVSDRPVAVPDLTRGGIGLKGGSGLEDVFRVLTLGMPGTPMPSFESLPVRDRWELAAYVRSLFEPISPGERIFLETGCTACHTLGRGKFVGPDLVDVRTRRDRAWLKQWLDDPPAMLARDPATRKLFQDYTIQMPKLNLSAADIEALLDFFERASPPKRP